MGLEGETRLKMTLNNVTNEIRVIISKEMKEDMIISKDDLKTFKVIPQGFPHEIVQQLKEGETIDEILKEYKNVVTDELSSMPVRTPHPMRIKLTENVNLRR